MLPVAQARNPAVILNLFSLALPSSPTANPVGTTFKYVRMSTFFHYFHCRHPGQSHHFLLPGFLQQLGLSDATLAQQIGHFTPQLATVWWFLIHQGAGVGVGKPPTFPYPVTRFYTLGLFPAWPNCPPPISHLLTLPQSYCAVKFLKHVLQSN